MAEEINIRRRYTAQKEALNAIENGERRIRRGRMNFLNQDFIRLAIGEHQIGVRAADIDTQSVFSQGGLLREMR